MRNDDEELKVGDFLRGIRIRSRKSQTEVAKALNISQKTLSRWECNVVKPRMSVDHFAKLCPMTPGECDILFKLLVLSGSTPILQEPILPTSSVLQMSHDLMSLSEEDRDKVIKMKEHYESLLKDE